MIITEYQYTTIKQAFAEAKTERQKISVPAMALNELGIYRQFFGKIRVKLILSKDYEEFCAMVYKKGRQKEVKPKRVKKVKKEVGVYSKNGKKHAENLEFIKDSLGKLTIFEIADELNFDVSTIRRKIIKNKISMQGIPDYRQIHKARKEAEIKEKEAIAEAAPKKPRKARTICKEDNKEKAGRIARIVTEMRKEAEAKVRLGKIVETIKKQVTTEKIRIAVGRDTFYICPQKYNTPQKLQAFIEKQEQKQRANNAKFNPTTHKLWK